jgi:hypothetical protein
MIDDEFDELLRDATPSYNAPPEPPRDAMWEAISRARSASAAMPIAVARHTTRWLTAAAGIAAALVAGIAIGRASREPATTPATVAVVAPHGRPTTPAARDSLNTETVSAPETVGAPAGITSSPSARQVASRRAARLAAEQVARRDRVDAAGDQASDATTYRFAVLEHLTRTEVLLTAFRAQARSASGAQIDAQFKSLSRELLGTTRLLLATRRGDDSALTRLLEDLELVLMQLSQYASDGRRVDLDALNQSIDKRNVLPKLRSTIPAGVSTSAGT